MKGRVVMRKDVPGDIQSIISFLEKHSLLAADRFMEAVFPTMEDLAFHAGQRQSETIP